jgi:dihydroflavonol-4-reductase
MTEPQAAGKRFICDAEFYWSQEIAHVLEEHFGQRGYRTPTRMLPNFAKYLVAIFDKSIRRILPDLGLRVTVSSEQLRNTLNWQPRPVEEAIVDTAESLIEFGI